MARSVWPPPPPPLLPPAPPGKISNSETCPAGQPVFAVKFSRRYRSLTADGRLIVTALPVAGLNVYPADGTSVVQLFPSVLPSTDSVWVRVAHEVDGGRSRVTDPTVWAEPRSASSHCGNALSVLSQ